MIRVIKCKNGWVIYPPETQGDETNVRETQQARVATNLRDLAAIINALTSN